MSQTFEAHDDPDIDSVWNWFEFQKALIAEERIRVLSMFQSGNEAFWEHSRMSQFTGLTRLEVQDFFDAQSGQLELLTMFELLATAEAILRVDFRSRVAAKRKDGLSRAFRKLHRKSGEKIRLDDDILVTMKEHGVSARVVAEFRGTLKLRHWLAHGRHWHPKLGEGYAPGDVFDIAKNLINSLPIL